MSLQKAARDLADKIDPGVFLAKFGAGKEQLEIILEKNTVTIGKLMEIAPEGTIDPTTTLYNTTMFAMAALLFIALLSNLAVKPVDEKHYMSEEQPEPKAVPAAE
jgi:hypothetical protein